MTEFARVILPLFLHPQTQCWWIWIQLHISKPKSITEPQNKRSCVPIRIYGAEHTTSAPLANRKLHSWEINLYCVKSLKCYCCLLQTLMSLSLTNEIIYGIQVILCPHLSILSETFFHFLVLASMTSYSSDFPLNFCTFLLSFLCLLHIL